MAIKQQGNLPDRENVVVIVLSLRPQQMWCLSIRDGHMIAIGFCWMCQDLVLLHAWSFKQKNGVPLLESCRKFPYQLLDIFCCSLSYFFFICDGLIMMYVRGLISDAFFCGDDVATAAAGAQEKLSKVAQHQESRGTL